MNKNYNKIYQEKRAEVNVVEEIIAPEIEEAEVILAPEIEETEVILEPEIVAAVIGTVVDCIKLNVRTQPNATAAVATEIKVASEVVIDIDKSTDDFYAITTATGLEGFCMKKFISVK